MRLSLMATLARPKIPLPQPRGFSSGKNLVPAMKRWESNWAQAFPKTIRAWNVVTARRRIQTRQILHSSPKSYPPAEKNAADHVSNFIHVRFGIRSPGPHSRTETITAMAHTHPHTVNGNFRFIDSITEHQGCPPARFRTQWSPAIANVNCIN